MVEPHRLQNASLILGYKYIYTILYLCVKPSKIPVERLGMFLNFDRYGRKFMFGRIPGSLTDKKTTKCQLC